MATLRELLSESYKEGMTLAEAEKEKSKKNIKNLKFFSVDRLKFLKRYAILILGMSNFAHFCKKFLYYSTKKTKNIWRNS